MTKKTKWIAAAVLAAGVAYAVWPGPRSHRDGERALRSVIAQKAMRLWERTDHCPSKGEVLADWGVRSMGRPMSIVCGTDDSGFHHIVLIDRETHTAEAY